MTELEQWEARFRQALDAADQALEQKFSPLLRRRSNRPAAGTTSNPKYDGLFCLDAKYSLGLNTGDGPGYTIDIRVATNDYVSEQLFSDILATAMAALQEVLPTIFPERQLSVSQIGHIIRITGDMSFLQ